MKRDYKDCEDRSWGQGTKWSVAGQWTGRDAASHLGTVGGTRPGRSELTASVISTI